MGLNGSGWEIASVARPRNGTQTTTLVMGRCCERQANEGGTKSHYGEGSEPLGRREEGPKRTGKGEVQGREVVSAGMMMNVNGLGSRSSDKIRCQNNRGYFRIHCQ